MNTSSRKSKGLAVLAAVCLLAVGCGGGGSSGNSAAGGDTNDDPQSGGRLVWAINTDSATLDPAVCGTTGIDRCLPIFETLLRYDLDEEDFVPGLAESFESEDGMHWILELREGVTFSDGTDFDAEAVAFNWDRIKDPANLSQAQSTAATMEWKVADKYTLEVTVEEPNYQLPWALVIGMGMIGSPTAIEEKGPDFGNEPVGAGPFVLTRWTRNSEAAYERNADYYQEGLPYLDEFVMRVIPEDEQRLNALRTGAIDVDWSLLTQDAEVMESEGYEIIQYPLIGGTGLMFNTEDPVVGDEELQMAMLHAYDSNQINAAAYPGDPGTDSFLSSESPYHEPSCTFPATDLEEAQRLFDSYLTRTGQEEVTVEFATYAGIPKLDQVSQVVKAQMEQIDGLTFELDQMDGATLSTAIQQRDFQTAMGATLSHNMDVLFEVFHSEGARNYGSYSNREVDEALETSRTSDDPEVVAEAYTELNCLISAEGPLRTWRWQMAHLYTNDTVNGLTIAPSTAGITAYLEEAWVAQ